MSVSVDAVWLKGDIGLVMGGSIGFERGRPTVGGSENSTERMLLILRLAVPESVGDAG